MKPIPPPKYTRDFYPQDITLRNHICNTWRSVSVLHGFAEYDGPIFEHAELYEVKSGEGILSELFSLEDRAGRRLAIRPEMTPTLARMVNQRINTLRKPIRWFSTPNCCRAERGQKGRLREFWQWNVDILSEPTNAQTIAAADAEAIAVLAAALQDFGLTPQDCTIHLAHRQLLACILELNNIRTPQELTAALAVMDRVEKLEPEPLAQYALQQGLSPEQLEHVLRICNTPHWLDALPTPEHRRAADPDLQARLDAAQQHLCELHNLLHAANLQTWCNTSFRVVRGLAYYTGLVFEVWDNQSQHRAIAGGGRYDNLLGLLGGPPTTGVGFGMGDVVLANVLAERNLLAAVREPAPTVYLCALADSANQADALTLAAIVRNARIDCEAALAPESDKRAFKAAENRKSPILLLALRENGQLLCRVRHLPSKTAHYPVLPDELPDCLNALLQTTAQNTKTPTHDRNF